MTGSNVVGNCTTAPATTSVGVWNTGGTSVIHLGLQAVALDASGNVTAGDILCTSSTAASKVHDNGSVLCSTGQQYIGVAATTASNVSAVTAYLGTFPLGVGTTTPAPAAPAITLTKSASPLSYSAVGQVVTCTFTVKNTGNVSLLGPFSVSDNKLGTVNPCGSGPLAPSASTTCTATHTITQADLDAGSITNSATVSNGTITSSSVNATATAVQNPALLLTKSASPTVYSNPSGGDVIAYSFAVKNMGNVTLSGPFSISDNKLGTISTCGSGPLAPGVSTSCTHNYTTTTTDVNNGSIINTATASTTYASSTVNSAPSSVTVTYSGGGMSISVTDTRYNGGDLNVCTGSGHIDGAPSNASSTMGPFQKAIHYAATNGIPTVTVPANAICNFPYVMSNTSGASCFAIDLENGVTIVGLGNDVINANVMGIQSSILPPNGCQTAWGQITQTDVFNVATNSFAVQYNHNGVGGFVSDATTAGQNKVFFTISHAESNFAVGNYVALFVQQATQDGVGPCDDTCTMQANLVTAVDPVGHSITLQDPLEYSFPSVGGTYPGPWIRVTPTTRHDVGVKNFTINTNIFPWQILEAWNVTMDSLTFNLQNCGACGGGIQDSDQWGVNTALHWNLTNSTLNWTRDGFKKNQETNQRESGYVLWQNVTITQPAGDTGGWTSMSYAEHVFRTTYDNVTLTGLIPDSTGAQQGAFMMGGSHNTLKNSHIS